MLSVSSLLCAMERVGPGLLWNARKALQIHVNRTELREAISTRQSVIPLYQCLLKLTPADFLAHPFSIYRSIPHGFRAPRVGKHVLFLDKKRNQTSDLVYREPIDEVVLVTKPLQRRTPVQPTAPCR